MVIFFYKVKRRLGDHWNTIWAGKSYAKAVEICRWEDLMEITFMGSEPNPGCSPTYDECPF